MMADKKQSLGSIVNFADNMEETIAELYEDGRLDANTFVELQQLIANTHFLVSEVKRLSNLGKKTIQVHRLHRCRVEAY